MAEERQASMTARLKSPSAALRMDTENSQKIHGAARRGGTTTRGRLAPLSCIAPSIKNRTGLNPLTIAVQFEISFQGGAGHTDRSRSFPVKMTREAF